MQKEVRVVYKSQPVLPSQRVASAKNEEQHQINRQHGGKASPSPTTIRDTTAPVHRSPEQSSSLEGTANKDDGHVEAKAWDVSHAHTSSTDAASYLNEPPPPQPASPETVEGKACAWTIPARARRPVRTAARKAVLPSSDDTSAARADVQTAPAMPSSPHIVTRTPHTTRIRVQSTKAAAASSIAVQLQRDESDDALDRPQSAAAAPSRSAAGGRRSGGGGAGRPVTVARAGALSGADREPSAEPPPTAVYTPTLTVAERVERLRRATEERLQRRYEVWRERQNIPGRPKTLVREKYGRLRAIPTTAPPSVNEEPVLRITDHEEVD